MRLEQVLRESIHVSAERSTLKALESRADA